MEYSSNVWDPHIEQEINKLASIQRRGARFITKDNKSREERYIVPGGEVVVHGNGYFRQTKANKRTIGGDKLLDIGTGPTVYSVISASRHVNEIHLSDYASQNRDVLQKWLDGAPNVPAMFEYYIKKENEGLSLEARAQAVREKANEVLPIDLLQDELMKDKTCKYDVITSSLCLESTATSMAEYDNIVSKIANIINPGGHVVMVGVLNENFYRVGDYKFRCLNLGRKDVEEAFEKAGFEIKVWKEQPNKNYEIIEENEYFDFESMFAIVAKKK